MGTLNGGRLFLDSEVGVRQTATVVILKFGTDLILDDKEMAVATSRFDSDFDVRLTSGGLDRATYTRELIDLYVG